MTASESFKLIHTNQENLVDKEGDFVNIYTLKYNSFSNLRKKIDWFYFWFDFTGIKFDTSFGVVFIVSEGNVWDEEGKK